MATFTWASGTNANWNLPANWASKKGDIPPPGISNSATDIATLPSEKTAYTVVINGGETFDIATLNIAGGSASNTTTLDIAGSLLTNALAYDGDGADSLVSILAGGLFNIRNGISATNDETLTIAGTGTGGHLTFGSATASGIGINDADLQFNFNNNVSGKNTGKIEFNGPNFTIGSTTDQIITNAAWGDEFVFDGADFTGDTFIYSGTTLTVKDESGGPTVLTMKNLSGIGLTSSSFIAVGDAIQVACYVAGTRILTVTGERLVETLMPGDLLLTLLGGELSAQPVKWIGHRRIDLATHPRPETVEPIRIQQGALTDNIPHNDLLLSPDHAIFIDGRLICAGQLVNGTTIRQEKDWPSVDYFHVELDEHAILLAEGLPAESYLDTGNRGFFANSDEPLVLHPDLTVYPTREAASCVPFVSDERNVLPVWQSLAERAEALGQPALTRKTTTDPRLHIVALGRIIWPLHIENGLHVFALPRGATEVRLVSRADPPTGARPWLSDRRCLGVSVERLVLRGASEERREVPLDYPGLSRGWWAVERDCAVMRRWTSGDAVLPLPAMISPTMLEIHTGTGAMAYVTSVDQSRCVA